jgi:Lrp/AsnC family transcriptional regulator, leucine-responsive regulatory protein
MDGLDKIDIKILKALQQNAKYTIKELADIANLSTSPTFDRVRRLEHEGYIDKYVAVLNPQKVGNGIVVLCNIRLKQHNRDYGRQFIEAVNQIEEVTDCYNTSGDFDFMMKIYVRDMEHYQNFVLNTLGTIDCIGYLNSIFVIGQVKSTNCIPIQYFK